MSSDEDDFPPDDGLASEDWTFNKIGEFIFYFSQIELTLRMELASALRLPSELFDAVTASYDFMTLCSVTELACSLKYKDNTAVSSVKKLVGRCKDINNMRVRIAHGTWMPNDGGPRVMHMSRQGLKTQFHLSTFKEMADVVEKCRRLSGDAIFLFDDLTRELIKNADLSRPDFG